MEWGSDGVMEWGSGGVGEWGSGGVGEWGSGGVGEWLLVGWLCVDDYYLIGDDAVHSIDQQLLAGI
jgi:hypothetical protein